LTNTTMGAIERVSRGRIHFKFDSGVRLWQRR
jgi:hypothetical protein